MDRVLDRAVQDALDRISHNFRIDGREDKGANGWLFFGTNVVTGVRVAIKFYWWGNQRDLLSEPRTLAQFSSPHISPILSAELVDGGWVYFICPRFAGDAENLLRDAVPNLYRAIDIALDVLIGVGVLHSAGFVHRDLKPANILIGDNGRAAIGDFGSVASVDPRTFDSPSSRHSVLYRPRESFEAGRFGPAGDIYQVSLFLYEMLGGALPKDPVHWLGAKDRERYSQLEDVDKSNLVDESIAIRVREERLIEPRSLPPYVSTTLRRVLRQQTAGDPASRLTSADFMNALIEIRRRVLDWQVASDYCVATIRRSGAQLRVSLRDNVVEIDRGRGFRRDKRLEGRDVLISAANCDHEFT